MHCKVVIQLLLINNKNLTLPHSSVSFSIIWIQRQSFLTIFYCLLMVTYFAVSSSPVITAISNHVLKQP